MSLLLSTITEPVGIPKLDNCNVWVFSQLIHRSKRVNNQLYKNPNKENVAHLILESASSLLVRPREVHAAAVALEALLVVVVVLVQGALGLWKRT